VVADVHNVDLSSRGKKIQLEGEFFIFVKTNEIVKKVSFTFNTYKETVIIIKFCMLALGPLTSCNSADISKGQKNLKPFDSQEHNAL
jgi:hypothetical protein